MYLQHYGLEQLPFRNTPDPKFFYETSKHNEALANLIYAVEQRRGFVLLSGEIGSGKTLVTHMLLSHLEDHAQIALIRNTHLNSTQLIRLICDEFGVQHGPHADKAAMLLSLNQFLVQQLAEDRLVVIVIDEAQNLSDKVMEELRMLSNLETSSDKLIQIVLVGQPELRDKVSQPHLEQLRQRIALTYHLEPLTPAEVAQYIAHRLKVAGPNHKVAFTPEAVAKVARFSRGTPRIINGLCDNALLFGFTAGTRTIDEPLIDRVLRQSMHLAPRARIGGAPTANVVPGRLRPGVPEAPAASEVTPAAPVEEVTPAAEAAPEVVAEAPATASPEAPAAAEPVAPVAESNPEPAATFPRPSPELRAEAEAPPAPAPEAPAAEAEEAPADKKKVRGVIPFFSMFRSGS